MATLARSPVMGGEWAGELAGGYGYVVLPLLTFVPFPFVVGSCPLAIDVGGRSGAPFPLSSGEHSRKVGRSRRIRGGGVRQCSSRGGHGGLQFGHVMVVLTPTSLKRGGARWGRGGPG